MNGANLESAVTEAGCAYCLVSHAVHGILNLTIHILHKPWKAKGFLI